MSKVSHNPKCCVRNDAQWQIIAVKMSTNQAYLLKLLVEKREMRVQDLDFSSIDVIL